MANLFQNVLALQKENPQKSIGQLGYEAYCRVTGDVSAQRWDNLPRDVKIAWQTAAYNFVIEKQKEQDVRNFSTDSGH